MNSYTRARFWKCALQVNPSEYIRFRGEDHGMQEAEYNAQLVHYAKENAIKVIGLAHHGSVEGADAIRKALGEEGILVFPGFEIASSEQIHFVCLYSEETTTEELHRYLGDLQLLNPSDGIRPSSLSANQLIEKVVKKHHGFIYAAHCVNESGLLNRKNPHIWENPLLKAAQIAGSIEDLNGVDGDFYRKVILNKEPAYKREYPMAVINAKDVARPEELADLRASCLIKMTKPGFEAFKLAFQDPESRVRLNSDVEEKYYSQLKSLKITGGYLDGLCIEFSEHLNAVIGGRGTGKSTLLECLRYVLGKTPIGKNAQKQHAEIIKENIGKNKARIDLSILSSAMNGQQFTISRRYGENLVVLDAEGRPSNFSPDDLLPGIEFFSQNEIYEITQDQEGQRKLLERFLDSGHGELEAIIREAMTKLAENRKQIVQANKDFQALEDQVARLPKIDEQLGMFKSLGIEEKLKAIPVLEKSKRLLNRAVEQEGAALQKAIHTLKDNYPDTAFLSDAALENIPQAENFRKIKSELDRIQPYTEGLLAQWVSFYEEAHKRINTVAQEIIAALASEERALEAVFAELPASAGKSGQEIGMEYQKLLKERERIIPAQATKSTKEQYLNSLKQQRTAIHNELSQVRAERAARFERALKKTNKKLDGKLKLTVKPEADRKPMLNFLLGCHLENVGVGRLSWVEQVSDFSPLKLSGFIQSGSEALKSANWQIPPSVADALPRMSLEQRLQLEEIELPDQVNIELNVSHGDEKNYKDLNRLSTGQQCTAILHLLLLDNKDPLVMDQPEDNLDNAFIAERIVAELRRAKISRQFLFATHNANIPVFGDAEWIGVFSADDGKGCMPEESQGAIDVPAVRDQAAEILEGGKAAFTMRKDKYGY